jgi:glycosyltransferase involved in cell wall biosynthesis
LTGKWKLRLTNEASAGRRRILQISTGDLFGGAERVAWNLFRAYRAQGHSSWLAVGRKRSNDPDVLVLNDLSERSIPSDIVGAIGRGVARLDGKIRGAYLASAWLHAMERGVRAPFDKAFGFEDFNYPVTKKLPKLLDGHVDIVHCHNLHGSYFDLRVLPQLSHQLPTILTLHDAWLLSGHCAHSFECERWKTGCGQCPDLNIYPSLRRDGTAHNWRRKRAIYDASNLFVATPCHWLMKRVEASMLGPAIKEARVIPNGVDTDLFRPAVDRASIRDRLGIPRSACVLLFVANGIRNNRWKDYATLRAAVHELARDNINSPLVFIGLGENSPPEVIGEARVEFIPFTTNHSDVVPYFQIADVYIHAAHAEAFPNTILEALACGTPVVATATGGISEQVDNGVTGFIVKQNNVEDIVRHIRMLAVDESLWKRLSYAALTVARRKFDLKLQRDAYLSWYENLLVGNFRSQRH